MQPPNSATIYLGLALATLLSAIVPATAQINTELPAFDPRIDPTEGESGSTGSRGSSRDEFALPDRAGSSNETCVDRDNFKLLVPSVSPLATDALPGFLAVLPAADRVDRALFVLSSQADTRSSVSFAPPEENWEPLYTATFPLPDESGVVRLLPPELPVLESDITYQWSISILCDNDSNLSKTSEFRIAEPSPEISDRLGDATCSEAPALCASDGIWYDPLVSLFESRLANPDDADLEAAWYSLLESAGLADYAGVRLVDRVEFQ